VLILISIQLILQASGFVAGADNFAERKLSAL